VYQNLQTCGLVWVCPVCAAKICAGRRAELESILERHVAVGGSVYMAALTVPHHAFQSCRELRRRVSGTFRKVLGGAPWRRAKAGAGVLGFVRSLEVTHGEHGWHPHLHLLVFLEAGASERQAQALGRRLFERWARLVERADLGSCNPSIWRFEKVASMAQAGDYVAKWGAAAELTQAHIKRARGGGRVTLRRRPPCVGGAAREDRRCDWSSDGL
jgi:hypothetical protein